MKEEACLWERSRERQRQRLQGYMVQEKQSSQGCPISAQPQLTLTLLLLRYRDRRFWSMKSTRASLV